MRYTALILTMVAGVGLAACDDDPIEPEFGLDAGLFTEFDVDNDALLTENEFTIGFENEGVFADLDTNFDGFLDQNEFDADLGAFADFDADADLRLNEDEFIGGTFDAFDTDDDTFVTETEFGVGVELF